MSQLNEDILEVFKKHNVNQEDILSSMEEVYVNFKKNLFYNMDINTEMVLILKDLIWYNMEFKNKNSGIYTFENYGNKYKYFFKILNGNNLILKQDFQKILLDINNIINNWDNEWFIVNLYSNFDFNVDLKYNMIVFRDKENPYNLIKENYLDFQKRNEYVYCKILGKLGQSSYSTILYNTLIELKEKIKECKFLDKSIYLNV